MTSWLRQHRYALDITLRRLALQPFSSLANLIVMALALALPLLGSAILVSVQPLAREVSVTPELTVFLRMDAPAGAAAQVAERIRRRVAELAVDIKGPDGTTECIANFTVSIGGAVRPPDGPDLVQLLETADAAMYEAKNTGRNCVRIGAPGG